MWLVDVENGARWDTACLDGDGVRGEGLYVHQANDEDDPGRLHTLEGAEESPEGGHTRIQR